MAERIEFVLSITDKMSGRLKTAQIVGKKTFDSLNRNNKRFNANLRTTQGNLKGVSSGLKGMLGTAVKLGLAFGAMNLIKTFTDTTIEMEQARVAFDVFLGSAEKGGKLIKELNQFANVTPFTNTEVIGAGKSLLAFGFQADKVKDTLGFLGDVAAGTGKPINEFAQIFGKVKAVGKLTLERLDQLTERGFNPLDNIAKRTGKTSAQLRKEISKGNITFKMLEQSFKDATGEGGKFENMMEKQSRTLGGRISTLQGQFQLFGQVFGDELIAPVLGKLIAFGTGFLESGKTVVKALKNIGIALRPVFEALGFLGDPEVAGGSFAEGMANAINNFIVPALNILVPILVSVVDILSTLWDWVKKNKRVIERLTFAVGLAVISWKAYNLWTVIAVGATAAWNFVAKLAIAFTRGFAVGMRVLNAAIAANPIGAVITAVIALIAVLLWAWNKFDAFREMVGWAFGYLETTFSNIGTILKSLWTKIKTQFIDKFLFGLKKLANIAAAVMTMQFGVAATEISTIGTEWDELSKKGEAAAESHKETMNRIAKERTLNQIKRANQLKEHGRITFFDTPEEEEEKKSTPEEEEEKKSKEGKGGKGGKDGKDGDGTPPAVDPATTTTSTAPELGSSTKMIGNKLEKPAIVNIDFNPEMEITINSADLPESTGELRQEFERFLVDLANLSGRGYK